MKDVPSRQDLLDTIRSLADKAIPIVTQRNAAYAGGGDVFGNLNLIETLSSGDIRTETGIVIRMGDKVSRLYSLTARSASENDESLEDTLIDLLGYSALLLLRHRTRTQTSIPASPTGWPHDYAWDGTIPCTGSYRCRWCKKVADAHPLDYSKVDRNELCPARTNRTNLSSSVEEEKKV